MKVSIRNIGPGEAAKHLATQKHNRPLRSNHVQWLAGAMGREEWRDNGEAIKFDWDGCLQDGQHRLKAIIEAGVTLQLVVVEGLVPEAQETMDTGAHRTMSDVLTLRNEKNTALLGAALGMLYRIKDDRVQAQPGALRPTTKQLLDLLDEQPEIRNFLHKARRVSERTGITASTVAGYWYVFSRIDKNDADDFFTKLETGIDLHEGDPIAALRRFLERERQSARKLPRYRIAGVLVKTWNLYRQGAPYVRTLSFRAGGANPEVFPQIDGYELTALVDAPDASVANQSKTPPRARAKAPRRDRAKAAGREPARPPSAAEAA